MTPPIDRLPDAALPVYLNTAAVGLQPASVLRQVIHHAALSARRGEAHLPAVFQAQENARSNLATLLGGQASEIGFCASTSHGMDLLAQAALKSPRRRILSTSEEFPASVRPWQGRGFTTQLLDAVDGAYPTALFESEMDDDVFAIVISAVQFATGTRTPLKDLAELAHRHGALLIANVTQAAGHIPVDLAADRVDFAVGSAYKWLMSGFGNGYVYAPQASRDAYPLPGLGWLSIEDPMALLLEGGTVVGDASIIEYGGVPPIARAGMDEATRMILDVGVDTLHAYGMALADALRGAAAERGIPLRQARDPSLRTQIVNLQVANTHDTAEALRQAGVVTAPRWGLRLSPHAYNTLGDLDRFWAAWDRLP